MQISRRQLLAVTGAIAAAGAVAGGALAWRWWDQPATADWSSLSEDEVRFLSAFSDAAFPPGGEPSIGGAEANLPRFVDGFIGHLNDQPRQLLKLLLHALESATLPSHGSYFSSLPPELQREVFGGWIRHDLTEVRAAVQSLVLVMGMGYTIHPDAVGTFRAWYPCVYGP